MRDPSAFLVISLLSGQQQRHPSSTGTSKSLIRRPYSLMPQVWKFLEPKQSTLTKPEEVQKELQATANDANVKVGDRNDPSMIDTRSWYRSAYPEMFQSSVYSDFDEGMLWTEDESMAVMQRPATIGAIRPWDGNKYYSDLVMDGLNWLSSGMSNKDVIMMLESPTSPLSLPRSAFAFPKSAFSNKIKFPIHDYPFSGLDGKTVMGPLRYACVTGNAFSTFLRNKPPPDLLEHWATTIPNYSPPTFSHSIPSKSKTICAYVPLEQFVHQHMINPYVHYDLGSKDCIPRMTAKTTKLLPNMHSVRPCVVKVTHAMGSRGIFIIRDDADELDCVQCLQETGRPDYVITEFVKIRRSLAAHFFIHPTGDITWFGTSENMLQADGSCSDDATIWGAEQQEKLQKLMTPYVRDVAQYCLSRGYFGACGIDVLMDRNGRGYVVDVNPRVTGTCPALMVFTKLNTASPSNSFRHGTFRRSKHHAFPGSAAELLQDVKEFNESNRKLRVVIFSLCQKSLTYTLLNIGVFGSTKEECDKVLNYFAPAVSGDDLKAGCTVTQTSSMMANDLLP